MPAAGHLGRELVLRVDLVERGRVALRPRQHLLGDRFGLVDRALASCCAAETFLNASSTSLRRIGLADLHALHRDARAIGVEQRLHPLRHALLDVGAAGAREHAVELVLGDRGAHRDSATSRTVFSGSAAGSGTA
jgi:hypothetical protein